MNIRSLGWLWVSVLVPAMIGATVTLFVLAGRAALEGRPIELNDLLSAVAVGVVLGALSAAMPLILMTRREKSSVRVRHLRGAEKAIDRAAA